MKNTNELNRILEILKSHEQRIDILEGRKTPKQENKTKIWYKPNSTIARVVGLVGERFFDVPRGIGEIISEFETKDYHLKAPDLTLPLRKIVRKELLKRTKKKSDGSSSKIWLYVKV